MLVTMATSKQALEKNIDAFNADVELYGGYEYTAVQRWSSQYASDRQANVLIDLVARTFPKTIRMVDIGCGDGAFTIKLAEQFGPASIRGVEPAAKAVEAARRRIPANLMGKVSFEVGNMYDLESRSEDLVIARGVMHHLDRPEIAIANLAQQFKAVVILEPNGYNPVLKVIEKVSPYHRAHEEKSYFPWKLNRWFRAQGMEMIEQTYSLIVPYFCPTPIAKTLSRIEPLIEALPIIREVFCSTNLVLYRS